MRRTIITSLIALTVLGGVASADRDRRGDRGDRGGDRWRGRDSGGVRVERRNYQRPTYRASRTIVRPTYRQNYRPHVRVVRQPIYVQRPVIRYRYYNQYQRPQLLVENYPARAGYIWVAGQWTWSGFEWTWQPGHYQPDVSYDQQYYNNGQYYDGQYYDGQYQQPYTSPSVGGSLDVNVNGSYSF